ncbi:MAG: hypothetical protein ABIX12_07090 [Rubrivivax sp.]
MSEDRNNKRRSGPERPTNVAFPRRKLGRVEHDERGNARMEWALLPEDATGSEQRLVLELLEEPGAGGAARPHALARVPGAAFQPYGGGASAPFAQAEPADAPRKPKDLRKLGEWLKMTRELEARRKDGERDD